MLQAALLKSCSTRPGLFRHQLCKGIQPEDMSAACLEVPKPPGVPGIAIATSLPFIGDPEQT